jgi:hypothetical protein
MKKNFLILQILSMIIFMSCTSQPKLINAQVEPELAAVGDSIMLNVIFSGSKDDLKGVYLTVREHPYDYPMIRLFPDDRSEKNEWSLKIRVPYDAYAAKFHLDINAFDKEDHEIISEGFENNSTGKAGTILLEIK